MFNSVIFYLALWPTSLVAKPSSIHLHHSTIINTGPETTGFTQHHDHRVITNPSFSIAEAIARDDRITARPYFEKQQALDAPLLQQPAVQDLINYGYLWPYTSKNSSLSPPEQSIRPVEPRTLFFLFDGMSLMSPSLQTKPTDD